MIKLKTKWFKKWAKKNKLRIFDLNKAIEALESNLSTSDLGSGLFKVRVPKAGKGKSGGFRTLIVFERDNKLFFVYGFSKNEKENLEKEELRDFKTLAKDLIKLKKDQILTLINLGEFFNLED
jgi:hypothetical protein